MKVRDLHSWDLDREEALRMQNRLAGQVDLRAYIGSPRRIAGADLAFDRIQNIAYGCVVVLEFPSLEVIETVTRTAPIAFPYIPGLLSFREAPLLLQLFGAIESEPQMVFVDGQGIAHPRRLGLASHLGLFLDIPTIGCAKSRLIGNFEDPAMEKGAHSCLTDRNGEILGRVLRSRDKCKPLFISPGHRIDIAGAMQWTLKCCTRYRIPEPTRLAHNGVTRFKKDRQQATTR